MKRLLSLPLLLIVFLNISSQDRKTAIKLFDAGNYEEAINEYLPLYEEDKESLEFNYNLAVSYLNTNIDKSLAIPHLETLTKNSKIDANAWYLLGRAYHFGYQFDAAIAAYEKFRETNSGSEANKIDAVKQIEYCENAKELMKFGVRVKFENLGKNVNSAYADYFPFIPTNESFLIFNSKRDLSSTEQSDGSYLPNIFMSNVESGKYQKAQPLPESINTKDGREEVVGLNPNGTRAIFYYEDFKQYGDLYECKIEGTTLGKPEKLEKNVNSKHVEIAACINRNGSKLYFASDRSGGYGGIDLYSCQLLPNGKWSLPTNLGPTINTNFDEDFPNLSPDGKALYFSSKGHTSMGGFDIFKATWDPIKNKYSSVQNLGYPLNTPEDNMNFRVSETGKHGYISAVRKGGYGDLDIYRVNFLEVEPRYTVISGTISSDDNVNKFMDLFIQVTDLETEEVYGDYIPNEKSLRYIMILPKGRYDVYIGGEDGYEEIYDEIEILDKSSFKSFITKDIKLKKK